MKFSTESSECSRSCFLGDLADAEGDITWSTAEGGLLMMSPQKKRISESCTGKQMVFICVELNPCVSKVAFPLVWS